MDRVTIGGAHMSEEHYRNLMARIYELEERLRRCWAAVDDATEGFDARQCVRETCQRAFPDTSIKHAGAKE
jgi:hypothetical protein